MADKNQLVVYREARELLRLVAKISDGVRFGDLSNQIRRSGISVVSNIAEGAGSGSDRSFARFVKIARGSVNELEVQLEMASDLGVDVGGAVALASRVGKRLTVLLRCLESG